MLFNLFLSSFNILLKMGFGIASLRDASFRKLLKEKKFTMLIKTMDAKTARLYRLSGGKFSSKRTDYPNPDFAIIWSDASTATSTLFNRNPRILINAFSDAMTSGKLKIEFNIDSTMNFFSMVPKMADVYKNFFVFKKN